MDLREVGYDDRDWINLAQDRDRWRAYILVNEVMRNYQGDNTAPVYIDKRITRELYSIWSDLLVATLSCCRADILV
ncbi:hypothetical protein ANN_19042 [Periplaneta americana]|uniref:Uncharacterized protein n=1 Tax=Periplaneta americana TaxID=6978 RepID=A0ABQ8SQD8_PERAM|nr:hypothetical protein ANN_19042 [Periplaneta americana]